MGYIGINQGNPMASVAALAVDLLGVAGRGSMPHKAVDPIAMASEFVTAIYTMMAREIHPLEPAVFTFGTIHGGDALNSVGSKVTVMETFRAYKHAIAERIWDGLYPVPKGSPSAMAAIMRCRNASMTAGRWSTSLAAPKSFARRRLTLWAPNMYLCWRRRV